MCVAVHYVSARGSCEIIAAAIAKEAKCVKEPLFPAYMPENLQLLFLGCEREYDKVTNDFIGSLNPDRARTAAIFYCGKDQSVLQKMRDALIKRGITVLKLTFTAPCRGLFGNGGPDISDCERATLFARDCLRSVTVTNTNPLERELLAAHGQRSDD